MSGCHNHCNNSGQSVVSAEYRKVLWICLIANAVMFVAQMVASYAAHSVSLLANSADFLSDAANYGISLYVLDQSLRKRAKASLFKGISLGLVGLWVAFETLHHALQPEMPEPLIMAVISAVALAANVGCAVLLYKYRGGDSNRESVWICSRNDAIGNIAVMIAAAGVFASSTIWPDIIVAAILGWLAVSGSWRIIKLAKQEMNEHS
ncbi:MAG: cation transporter [Alphaproteobacteria bacterium]|nr:cation transporter [Alphaproteobacteria bacterium]